MSQSHGSISVEFCTAPTTILYSKSLNSNIILIFTLKFRKSYRLVRLFSTVHLFANITTISQVYSERITKVLTAVWQKKTTY